MKPLIFIFTLSFVGFSQSQSSFGFNKIQLGPYLGLQKGKNTVIELGVEKRVKEVSLLKRSSHAYNIGANFDLNSLLVGIDGGVWFRPHSIGLLWGGQLAIRSDFNQYIIGVSPTIGYKIWFIHATLGYYYYPLNIPNIITNNLYVSLRLNLTQNSKWKKHERS